MIPKSQAKAVKKYKSTHYDRFEINLPKGELEPLKAIAASSTHKSLNAWIQAAIEEKRIRDGQ